MTAHYSFLFLDACCTVCSSSPAAATVATNSGRGNNSNCALRVRFPTRPVVYILFANMFRLSSLVTMPQRTTSWVSKKATRSLRLKQLRKIGGKVRILRDSLVYFRVSTRVRHNERGLTSKIRHFSELRRSPRVRDQSCHLVMICQDDSATEK